MFSELSTPLRASSSRLPVMQTSQPFVDTQAAILYLPDANPLLLAISASSYGCSRLFVINLPGGTVEKLPLADNGGYVVAGTDGMAYLGTVSGRILKYDPASKSLTEYPSTFRGETFRTGFASNNGKIFFGSKCSSLIVEIDPVASDIKSLPKIADRECPQQVSAFIDLPGNRVAAFMYDGNRHSICLLSPGKEEMDVILPEGLTGEREVRHAVAFDSESFLLCTAPGNNLFLLSAESLEVTSSMPSLPDDDSVHCLRRAGGDLLAGGVSGAIYRFEQGSWRQLGVPMPYDPLLFDVQPDGCLAGVTYHGRLIQSTPSQSMFTIGALSVCEPNGLAITAMGMSPDRKLYFAFANNMRLGRWNPEANENVGECFVAAPFPGEVTALGFAGERLLMGFADRCGLMAYYPDLPYRLLENPRLISPAGTEQRRPLGPMVHHEKDVYFAASAVGDGEGAIVRFHPRDNELTLLEGIIPGQNITSLVADRLSGLLVAGGSIYGNANQAAALALWSPYEEHTIRLVTPFFEAASVIIWAAEGGRLYVTDGGTRLAILSSEGEVLEVKEFPLGKITSLATNQDGKLYGLAGGWMFHLNAETQTFERLVEAEGIMLTEVRRGLFAFTNHGYIYTVQL